MNEIGRFFELKFRDKLREAFVFFDHDKNGKIIENEWITGLHALNLDYISRDEAQEIFRYLDSEK